MVDSSKVNDRKKVDSKLVFVSSFVVVVDMVLGIEFDKLCKFPCLTRVLGCSGNHSESTAIQQ